jgi:hypothetical protein
MDDEPNPTKRPTGLKSRGCSLTRVEEPVLQQLPQRALDAHVHEIGDGEPGRLHGGPAVAEWIGHGLVHGLVVGGYGVEVSFIISRAW